MAAIKKFPILQKLGRLADLMSHVTVAGVLLTALLFHFTGIAAVASQTREQCDKCCKSSQQDEYYLEQCKLKCFRNPDHCAEQKGRRETGPSATEPAPPREGTEQPSPPTAVEPAQQPSPATPRPAHQKPAPRTEIVLPNPLNLVPGKEWEAAGQILVANGISPQSPKFQPAVRNLEAVLIEFAKANPAGGKLPRAQLEKIIRQAR